MPTAHEPTPKIPRVSKKKPEYTGSRWAGLVLFIITLLISLLFYLKGQLNSETLTFDLSNLKLPSFLNPFFGPSVYTLEK